MAHVALVEGEALGTTTAVEALEQEHEHLATAHEAPDEEQAEERVLASSSAALQQPYLRSRTGASPHSQKTSGPNPEVELPGIQEEYLLREGCPELVAPQRQELLDVQLEDLLGPQLVG